MKKYETMEDYAPLFKRLRNSRDIVQGSKMKFVEPVEALHIARLIAGEVFDNPTNQDIISLARLVAETSRDSQPAINVNVDLEKEVKEPLESINHAIRRQHEAIKDGTLLIDRSIDGNLNKIYMEMKKRKNWWPF